MGGCSFYFIHLDSVRDISWNPVELDLERFEPCLFIKEERTGGASRMETSTLMVILWVMSISWGPMG